MRRRSQLLGQVWSALQPIKNEVARRVGLGAVVLVPLLAAIETALRIDKPGDLTILGSLMRVFEDVPLSVPLNLIRLFWSGVALYLASLLIQMARPPLLLDYDEWSRTKDCATLREELTQDGVSPGEADARAGRIHERRDVPVVSVSTAALIPILALLALAIYLAGLVVWENGLRVLDACEPMIVLSAGSSDCNRIEN